MFNFTKLPLSWPWRAKRAGLNMVRLHEITGFSKGHLSEVTRGKSLPSLDTINTVERALSNAGEPFKLEYLEDE